MGQPGDLWEQIRDLQTTVEIQQGVIELLTLQQSMHNAHIENLIERVAELENPRNQAVRPPTSPDVSSH